MALGEGTLCGSKCKLQYAFYLPEESVGSAARDMCKLSMLPVGQAVILGLASRLILLKYADEGGMLSQDVS
jgi:hypothetical protein